MKIDLLTLNVFLLIQLAIQAAGWVALRQGLRGLRGMRGIDNITLGSVAAAAGTFLHPLREVLPAFAVICVANFLVMSGYALVMVGLGQFSGRPPLRWLAAVMLAFTALVWPAMLTFTPDNISLRIVVFSGIVGVLAGATGLNMIRAHKVPAPLRWTLVVLNLAHSLSSFARAIDGATAAPLTYYLADEPAQILWFLGTILYASLHFIALIALVGSELLAELTKRNAALAEEIDARARLQDQLSAALAKEGNMRREQRLFIDMVGHDFRTPVAVIDRAAEMLEGLVPQKTPPVLQRLATIRVAGRRLRRLMDTFLANERLESGLNDGRRERVPLAPMLRELCADMEPLGGERLKLELEPGAEALMALGDPDWLATVCGNLIDNALKYSPPESLVTIRLGRRDGRASIAVMDKGIGIPAADLGQIGERFFRAGNAGGAKGTGLGLYAARRLIEAQGGDLGLQSEPGQGTTAELRLALVNSDEMQQITTK